MKTRLVRSLQTLFLLLPFTGLSASGEDSLVSSIYAADTSAVSELLTDYQGDFYLDSKESLLQLAIAQHSSDIVAQLVSAGADINGPTKGFRQKSHLHLAVESGDDQLVETLLSHGANIDAVDKLGQSALSYAVFGGDEKTIALLIQHGSNFQTDPTLGEDTLLYAVKFGDSELVESLLDLGAKTTIKKLVKSQCSECHGLSGESIGIGGLPHIAGQSSQYIQKQLHDFQRGSRKDDFMSDAVMGLTEQMIVDVADYFGNLPQVKANLTSESGNAEYGKSLYYTDALVEGVPSCFSCHARSSNENLVPGVPTIAGMNSIYLVNQLVNFRSGRRSNDDSRAMESVMSVLSDSDIEDIAVYLSAMTD